MNKLSIRDRLKNYGLWISIAALIPMVLKGFNINILPENYDQIVTAILSILVMAGILNNPTTECKGFLDDSTESKKKLNDVKEKVEDNN
ncbi:phage holin [Clostridium massiliamazoniense]|uniref:phage holin n=1 Tax=Clostridium massiliamazoniense TaxID=1347366 RepID=UPI0006D82F0D|nr:phage holin [Clostridium massiliamazoniense]